MEAYKIPENLYGLAIAEPLQLSWQVDGGLIVSVEYVRIIFLVVVNYIVQFLFLFRIKEIYAIEWDDHLWTNAGGTCDKDIFYLQITCVFVFNVAIFGEIRETMDMFVGLWACPVSSEYARLSLTGNERHTHHGVVVESGNEADASNSVDRMERQFTSMIRHGVKGEHKWNLHQMNKYYKFLCLSCLAFPKLIIASFLLVSGSYYIMLSPDLETLILNTLAVMFVLDVDEYFYHTFTTSVMKTRLACMEWIELNPSARDRVSAYIMATVGMPTMVICTTCGVVYFHRRHCMQGYRMPFFS